MENRRGSGIFLGVVGVATLVVAIIGATFAYFSVSETATTPVNVTAYEFDADVSLTQVLPEETAKLIPLDPEATVTGGTDTNLLYAVNTAKCISEINGVKYQACALYKLEVKNNGTAPITMTGVLKTTRNDSTIDGNAFKYLTYQPLDGTEGALDLEKDGEALESEILPLTVDGTMALEELTIQPGEEQAEVRYFVVYLDEQAELNQTEMGSTYTGQITYTDKNSGSQLTATFTATNPGV